MESFDRMSCNVSAPTTRPVYLLGFVMPGPRIIINIIKIVYCINNENKEVKK